MGPGDRRDGQPLIFGWGSHLTRAQKQQYRGRFVLAGGIFIFALIALVIGAGAVQQLVLKPRTAVASVNGNGIQRQWYDKNLAYTQFVLQHQTQDIQSQYQAIVANQQGNARATATANPQPSGSPTAFTSGAPEAGGTPDASGTPAPSGTAGPTLTPSPTFNPQESATVAALSSQFATDQAQLNAAQQLTMDNLIDADLLRQNAGKFDVSVSSEDVAAQAKKTADQIGGDAALKLLLNTAHLSQGDFNQIQYDVVLRDKFQAYFADHPEAAPSPSATAVPSPTATVVPEVGPLPPTPTAVSTPLPAPGATSLGSWLREQRTNAIITQTSFPLPPA